MKNNSLRLRLTQSEVARFAANGLVEEIIEFGGEPLQKFIYSLEINLADEQTKATFEHNQIKVFVAKDAAEDWINTARVGIETTQDIGEGKNLRVLIEKDFTCLEPRGTDDDAADAFPHPLKN